MLSDVTFWDCLLLLALVFFGAVATVSGAAITLKFIGKYIDIL